MHSEEDIKPIDLKAHLIKNEKMYFGARGANPYSISCHIAEAALVLGSADVGIRNVGGWWLITSNLDWFNAQNSLGSNEDNLFKSLRAFPEGGQNDYRGEIMAMYYSSALAITTAAKSKLIKGNALDFESYDQLVVQHYANRSVLGFKFNAKL